LSVTITNQALSRLLADVFAPLPRLLF